MYTYLNPSEYIGIPCQQEQFDLDLPAEKLQNDLDTSELYIDELERIPLIRKVAAPADIIYLEEIEYKICQYCQLWKLYAETSVELKKIIQTVTGKCSDSIQGVWTVHHRHPMTSGRGNEIIHHGKRTKNNQKQRTLLSANNYTTGYEN